MYPAHDDRDAPLGFEDKLWASADVLRSNLDPSAYKHVVLGLVFLKYASDTATDAVFRVPPEATWSSLAARARSPGIGEVLDAAMVKIEAVNPNLHGALPKVYTGLDADRLGALMDLIGQVGLGSALHRQRDTLGRVYEYFLSRFASAEGRGGGEFYTPPSVVRVLVEVLQPDAGRVYDPCCGSGGMFVQSLRFVENHGGRREAVTVYGQESNATTWRMARMNLAIRGIEADLGRPADTLHADQHPDLRADFVLANPPFNISSWGGERLAGDPRWRYGIPPAGNANFAWLQHIVHHLAPSGSAGIVLANGSMSSQQSGEGEIRRRMVEADLVDCMVALPGQLFYATQIPVCVWFLTKTKADSRFRRRTGEVLFLDASRLGRMATRVHRVLDEDDVRKIAETYRRWRAIEGGYADEAGFCKSADLAEIQAHGFVLTPGRYVGAPELVADGEAFADKMSRLAGELREQHAEGRRLDLEIAQMLGELGWAE